MSNANSVILPKYRSHKEVWAVKIKEIKISADIHVIVPESSDYDPIAVSKEYIDKHDPKVGGYFVRYENGHESFSPAEAFESGYTPIVGRGFSTTDVVSVPRRLLKRLTTWVSCMSYNDSYFGEQPGELKRLTSEIDRLV